jgi:hypothetical protein
MAPSTAILVSARLGIVGLATIDYKLFQVASTLWLHCKFDVPAVLDCGVSTSGHAECTAQNLTFNYCVSSIVLRMSALCNFDSLEIYIPSIFLPVHCNFSENG